MAKEPGWDGGGFSEGQHGRGPTPYSKSMSHKPHGHGMAAHAGTAGRGGKGRFGKGDGFKSHAPDIAHPQTHAEFESLGTEVGGE